MINESLARKYCKEDISKIKNYDLAIADKTQTWDCHHMTETWWGCSAKDLIENECYYNRKACELVFLTKAEHTRMHNKVRTFSDETKLKISESLKGRTLSEEHARKMHEAWKGKHHSEDTRKKISEAKKGCTFTEEARRKMSEAHKRRWALRKQKMMEER